MQTPGVSTTENVCNKNLKNFKSTIEYLTGDQLYNLIHLHIWNMLVQQNKAE